MLVAVDGTSSGEFLYGQNGMLGAPRTSTGRFRSHVRNFYQDYRGPKAYWNGPANFRTGSDSSDIHRGVISWITSILEKNPNEPIDMVGHSRGGYIAMEVARELKEKGVKVNCMTVFPKIRWMGLYDPVDMVAGYGESEKISSNVEAATVLFAAGSPGGRIEAQSSYGRPTYGRSRPYFNRADGGVDDSNATSYTEHWIFGTHAAIGGAPWDGDHPG